LVLQKEDPTRENSTADSWSIWSESRSCDPNSYHFIPTRLWRWNRQSVPKRWHIKFRRRGITQKKAYNIQNTAKVSSQESYHFVHIRLLLMESFT